MGLEQVQAVHVSDCQRVDFSTDRQGVPSRDGIEGAEAEAALPAGGAVRLDQTFGITRIFSHERTAAVAGEVGAEDADFHRRLVDAGLAEQ